MDTEEPVDKLIESVSLPTGRRLYFSLSASVRTNFNSLVSTRNRDLFNSYFFLLFLTVLRTNRARINDVKNGEKRREGFSTTDAVFVVLVAFTG